VPRFTSTQQAPLCFKLAVSQQAFAQFWLHVARISSKFANAHTPTYVKRTLCHSFMHITFKMYERLHALSKPSVALALSCPQTQAPGDPYIRSAQDCGQITSPWLGRLPTLLNAVLPWQAMTGSLYEVHNCLPTFKFPLFPSALLTHFCAFCTS